MRPIKKIATALLAAALPLAAYGATLGGADYATQYDYREFYTAVGGKTFRAELLGNPFPGLATDDVARRLLPVMQANKPILQRQRRHPVAGSPSPMTDRPRSRGRTIAWC